jgi:hypothetical protein
VNLLSYNINSQTKSKIKNKRRFQIKKEKHNNFFKVRNRKNCNNKMKLIRELLNNI